MFGFESFEDRERFVVFNTVSLLCIVLIAAFALTLMVAVRYVELWSRDFKSMIFLAAFAWLFMGAIREMRMFSDDGRLIFKLVAPVVIITLPFVYLYNIFVVVLKYT